MNIEKEIGKCFSCDDHKLGLHATEEKNLKDLIKKAKADGVGLSELEKEVVYYLWKKNIHETILKTHIEEQVDKLKKLY